MIDRAYAATMARYNRWQNDNLCGVADTLSDAERRRERGAFFGSIHQTLSHILWADRVWLARLTATEAPPGGIAGSVSLYSDWEELKMERGWFDRILIDWADNIEADLLAGTLTYYSGAAKRELTKPHWILVTHMFNHQTHHRGQVHAMLTQAGGKPSDTDLPLLPN